MKRLLALFLVLKVIGAAGQEADSGFAFASREAQAFYHQDYLNSLRKTDPIRAYTLPDPLIFNDGTPIKAPMQWYDRRRDELLELFHSEIYGHAPGRIPGTDYTVLEQGPAFGGKAIRKQIRIDFNRYGQSLLVLMYLPAKAKKPVPVFLGLNFKGNTSISDDPAVIRGRYASEERGIKASRWPVETILCHGYGLVTCHYFDIRPDRNDGWKKGVTSFIFKEGQTAPEPNQWGSISEWAWGLSRILDYLEKDRDVNAKRVAVFGHSRLGKTALLAGARDTRFAMVISNDSGSCGAALSRRLYGETIKSGANLFPYWYCTNFYKYLDDVDSLPVDQHELLALVAPRALYVASAEGDAWADPTGERLSFQEAQKVYGFLGVNLKKTGYHIREGKHDITVIDWRYFLDFADRNL